MYVCREKRNSNNCKKGRERRQHIRHGGKLLQVTVCVVWFVASHVPPNIASEVTWNVCINVPAPQLEEQLPLIYWPIQFTAANKQYMSRFRYGGGRKYGTQKNGIIVGTEMDSVSQKKVQQNTLTNNNPTYQCSAASIDRQCFHLARKTGSYT